MSLPYVLEGKKSRLPDPIRNRKEKCQDGPNTVGTVLYQGRTRLEPRTLLQRKVSDKDAEIETKWISRTHSTRTGGLHSRGQMPESNTKNSVAKIGSGNHRKGLRRTASIDDDDVPSHIYNRQTPNTASSHKLQALVGISNPVTVLAERGRPIIQDRTSRTTFQRLRSKSVDFSDSGEDEDDHLPEVTPRGLDWTDGNRPMTTDKGGKKEHRKFLRRKVSKDDIAVGGFKTHREAVCVNTLASQHLTVRTGGGSIAGVGGGVQKAWTDAGEAVGTVSDVLNDPCVTEESVLPAHSQGGLSADKRKSVRDTSTGELICSSAVLLWRCKLRAVLYVYFHEVHDCYEVVGVDAEAGAILPRLYLSAPKICDLNEVLLGHSQTVEMRLKRRSLTKKERIRLGAEYILASIDAEYTGASRTSRRLFIRKFHGMWTHAPYISSEVYR